MKTEFIMVRNSSSRGSFVRACRSVLLLTLSLSLGACTWFTDFKTQPSIEPWQPMSQELADTLVPPRGQPMFSVPLQGSVAPAFAVSYAPLPATLDSLASIANPVAADERSLNNGRMYYQINCSVCHGSAGDGNGHMKRINRAYAWSPSLMTDVAKGHPDGYIFGMIRNGRGSMPSYNRIEEHDRWDIVNYLRTLQAGAGDTTSAGYPGQNGSTVPGPSLTAPTVPSKYARPDVRLTPGSSGANSATVESKNEGMGVRALHGAPHAEKEAGGEAVTKKPPVDSKEMHL